MSGNHYCLAILDALKRERPDDPDLQYLRDSGLEVSLLRKAENGDDDVRIFRLPEIGAVICEGPLTQKLLTSLTGPRDEYRSFATMLNDMGVPGHHHGGYGQALLNGHTLIILRGSGRKLRMLSRIIEELTTEKPILYFT